MQLIVDIGNSNIVLAIYRNDSWYSIFRYETRENQPQLFFERGIKDILLEWGVKAKDISLIGISSVVPDLNDRLINASQHVVGLVPKLITPEILMALDMHVPKPFEIGSDLVANAYAASRKYNTNAIIVDFGTALTFTVVDLMEGIKGVTIAPGLKTAIQSLAGNTAQLPLVSLEIPTSVIGQSTAHAMQAGVMVGYKGLVKEIIRSMKRELAPMEYKVISTGGLSQFVEYIKEEIDITDKHLTLDGIRMICNYPISIQ